MGQFTFDRFESAEAIPDVVLPHMLLPVDKPRWHAVKEAVATELTTTPVEVAFVATSYDLVLTTYQEGLLNVFTDEELGPTEISRMFENNLGNHMSRVIFRAMLDPQRYAPINLGRMYREESKYRGYIENEFKFFDTFIEFWGVLNRPNV